MSRTLFWYMFGTLFRVFATSTLALTGIMGFTWLLRPLTQYGLQLSEVNRLMAYMVPAMIAYSLPVAALFATTFVYGRLASDNELTALRASGIPYLSITRFSVSLPALVLGLLVATISLLMLCFIVPVYTMKMQEVIHSNIARILATEIERHDEIPIPGLSGEGRWSIVADSARLLPQDPAEPRVQKVELIGPAITSFANSDPAMPGLGIPQQFWLARSAIVSIARASSGESGAAGPATLTVQLYDGIKFPREFAGDVQAGVGATTFGPMEIAPQLHEDVQYMKLSRLKELADDPGQSQTVQTFVRGLIRRDQIKAYLQSIAGTLKKQGMVAFPTDANSGDDFQIGGQQLQANFDGDTLRIVGVGSDGVWLSESHGPQHEQSLQAVARELRIDADPDAKNKKLNLSLDLYTVQLTTVAGTVQKLSFMRDVTVPMSPEVVAVGNRSLSDYEHESTALTEDRLTLIHEQLTMSNAVFSELHGRASFAVSCLSLVMVGCALGVMFKSGNFMNAFAVSFMPAILCITLIVCGKNIATRVPWDDPPNFHNPLQMALWFIWLGNLSVVAAAVWLSLRLQKR